MDLRPLAAFTDDPKMRHASLRVATLGILAVGCANGMAGAPDSPGGGGMDAPIDAARSDAPPVVQDAPRPDSPLPDAPGADAARDAFGDVGACPTGEHRCGAMCVPDGANTPATGCRLGCGTACMPPANGMATCSAAGLCDFTCTSPWVRDGAMCRCTPTTTCAMAGFMCGMLDNGCGTLLNCGMCSSGTCVDGRCGCTADTYESNDSNATARDMGRTLRDSDNPTVTITNANIHAMGNEDWFSYRVEDGSDGGTPRVFVTLSGIPAGADYDLAAYFACDSRDDGSTCDQGAPDNLVGHGCSGAATGSTSETIELKVDCNNTIFTADNGRLYIRVRPRTWMSHCANYSLQIRVE